MPARWCSALSGRPESPIHHGAGSSLLEALGNLGDFLGGIAVVITLIYLAFQIRENSRSTRLAAMQSTMLAAQNIGRLPAQDRNLARVVRVGMHDPDDLDADEFQQFRYYLINLLRVHEDMFVQHAHGVIDDETWIARAKSLRTIFLSPGGRKVWDSSDAYRPDFSSWMDAHLEG